MAFNYRPAGLSDSDSDSDNGIVMTGPLLSTSELPEINSWFAVDHLLPFENYQIVPQRGGCWLELFFTFNPYFACRFDKFATFCLITPQGLEIGPYQALAYDHFRQGIQRQQAMGQTPPWIQWAYFLCSLGIHRYNFVSKIQHLLRQHCVGHGILLRWRSDLSDY